GYILVTHTYRLKTVEDNFDFGWEMGRIGRALAQGEGFSNPFLGITGPTAWEPPFYPFLIAGVFKVFGIYSRASALVLLSINSLLSALTCLPIFLIGKRCFNEKVAVWTAWTWALLPSVIFWCTRWVWETSLAALLLAIIFWLTLVMEDADDLKSWLGFGLLWGVAALTNPSLLSFLPASGLWAWWRRAIQGRRSLSGVVLAAVMFVACVAPWLVRNDRTFGQPIFIRSNFGAELRLGNGPGANGLWMEYLHPTKNVVQMQQYREMGEMAYVAERKREAMAFIREDYGRFAGLCVKRFVFYWGGLPHSPDVSRLAPVANSLYLASSLLALWGLGRAIRKRRPGAWLFFWLVLCYPLVYYVAFPHPRYRHPIEPELLILIVYVISEAGNKSEA
ncbi:MAG: glycosyltransferase family 39 protein, partial [Terriglobales bacterium]